MKNNNALFLAVIGVLLACFILALAGLLLFAQTPRGANFLAGRTPTASLPAATPTLPPTLTASPTAVPSPTPAPAGKIVLTCQVFGQQNHDQICIMNADGSGYRQLTSDEPSEYYYPSLSPDGNSVVYASNRLGGYQIYEMDLASGTSIQLTHGIGEVNAPEISPDGSRIVFTDIFGHLSRIWLMDRDGSNPHELYSQAGADSLDPTWSPDGTRILFAVGAGTDKLLYTINVDGSGLQPVSADFHTRGRTDWSPDGQWISSYAGSGFRWKIYLLKPDGTQLHQVQVGGVGLAPAFSPDGQWIVFTGYLDHPDDPDGCEIYIARLDGSGVTRLTNNTYCDWQPRWGP